MKNKKNTSTEVIHHLGIKNNQPATAGFLTLKEITNTKENPIRVFIFK